MIDAMPCRPVTPGYVTMYVKTAVAPDIHTARGSKEAHATSDGAGHADTNALGGARKRRHAYLGDGLELCELKQ